MFSPNRPTAQNVDKYFFITVVNKKKITQQSSMVNSVLIFLTKSRFAFEILFSHFFFQKYALYTMGATILKH